MHNSTATGRVRAHIFVTGRVQGVGYRLSTVREARRRGVNGWVRNLADGRVEAVFEGDRGGVEALVNWCRLGPPAAVVQDMDLQWSKPQGLRGFEVIPF
jgi:acylphosphatase